MGCNSVLKSSGLKFFPKLVQCPFAPIFLLLLLLLFSHQPQDGALRSCSSYVPDSTEHAHALFLDRLKSGVTNIDVQHTGLLQSSTVSRSVTQQAIK